MRKWILRAILAVACTTGGFVGGMYVDSRPDDAYCPSEDSCWVDYTGGRWVIHEQHVDDAPAWVTD